MSVTRLAPPAAFHPDIPRPGVYARLQSALHRQILALLSPGGFGKTCALRGFWPQLAGNKAWLDVRGAGDDFATHWRAALAQAADGGLIVIDGIEDLRPEYGRELTIARPRPPEQPGCHGTRFARRRMAGIRLAGYRTGLGRLVGSNASRISPRVGLGSRLRGLAGFRLAERSRCGPARRSRPRRAPSDARRRRLRRPRWPPRMRRAGA